MNKNILISIFVVMFLMFPAVVGAATVATCYDGITGNPLTPCPYDYVDVSETGSTISSTIVGNWRWFNNKDYDIRSDTRIYDSGVQVGTWVLTDGLAREYTLTWNGGYIDTLILSLNGQNLDGANQYGMHVSATRIGSAYPPCMASIDSELLLNIPYLGYSTFIFGDQYLATEFAYVPFLPLPGIYFVLTDYSMQPTAPSCTALSKPTLSYDNEGLDTYLDIHIPDVMLPNGTHLWVGLRYDDNLSLTTGKAYFYVYVFAHK